MNQIPIFSSDRLFEVWRYTVSHRQLLLRSNKSNSYSTRVEVLFKDISLMQIKPLFLNLTIVERGYHELQAFGFKASDFEGGQLYYLQAEGPTYYVVAGAILWHEDDGEYSDPSGLISGPIL